MSTPVLCDEGAWLGSPSAAAALGISPTTLYKLINDGEITANRIGRSIRLRSEDIDAFVASCRIRPGDLDHLASP